MEFESCEVAYSLLWAMQQGFKVQALANVKVILQLKCVYMQ
jgi:hypothetical protein